MNIELWLGQFRIRGLNSNLFFFEVCRGFFSVISF